jgi:outer membrane protein assembly factor BamB
MTGSIRRTALVLLGSTALACFAFPQSARAQVQRRAMGVRGVFVNQQGMMGLPDASAAGASITLPTNNRLKKKLDAAQDYMKDEAWEKAVAILQSLLDAEEDVFVPPAEHGSAEHAPAGKDKAQWVSIRSEANRLLAGMPDKGLQYYRLSYGAAARGLLEQARATHDPELLAQVARRYLYTDAGAEATALLATYHLDRGRFSLAAVYFERLIAREGLDKLSRPALLQAALAFHRVSAREEKGAAEKYRKLEESVWKELADQGGGRLRLGDRAVELADLRAEVNSGRDVTAGVHRHDWAMYRGNASRSAVSSGDRPFMEKRWSVSTTREEKTRELLAKAVTACTHNNQAVLPQFFPIAADGKLIYRTYWGLQAVDLKDPRRPCWDSLLSEWSLDALDGKDARQKATYLPSQMVAPYMEIRPSIFFENSVIGTLSTDNNQVYVVEDLAVPPSNPMGMGFPGGFPGGFQQPGYQNGLSGVSDALNQNELQAYNVRSGKMVWHVGGRGGQPAAEGGDKKESTDLSETFFLGPPLPMHGKLYVLTEKNQELRLVCLDAAKGDVVWVQLLANTQTKLSQDPIRRIHAAHLSYGEGILVCPTNAGMVFGVDLLSHTLVWAYDYRDKTPPAGPPTAGAFPPMGGGFIPGRVIINAPGGMPGGVHPGTQTAAEWKVTAPVVVQGHVVFTAPDGSAVHCVNLRDGSSVWKANRQEDDLYLGGVANDRVLIVSKKDCRGLSLADGKEMWRVPTGMPSGQGVVSDNLYYLPLKSYRSPNEAVPAVLAIDVEKGVAGPPSKPRKGDVVPGNLLVYDGDVVSQTVDEIAIFPQLRVKRQQIDELIGKNPEDPVGLTERGELRLAQNELQGAVDDLRTALRHSPPPETRAKARHQLYEALTEYLDRRFTDAEKYLDEYKALCTVETDPSATAEEKQEAEKETRRRKADYLCLLAKGREGQGRMNEAFQCYTEFGALSDGKELLSVVGDRAVKAPADVWARGRINAMMARATAEQRAPLEKLLARRWEDVRGAGDLEGVRKFAAMFGSQFAVGREARLYLAEKLLEEPGTANLLEAERQLLLLRGQHEDRAMAARAVETLARLMARKGLLEDAAYYYRVLGRDFGDVPVRDGKTGADLLNELATDKRFLPYIDQAGPAPGGRFTGRVEQAGPQQPLQAFTFEPADEVVPFFGKYRVALDLNFHKFRLIDRQTNESVMEKDLTKPQAQQGPFPNMLFQVQMSGNVRFPYQTVGHAVVLNLGETVCAVDPVNRVLLWELNLAELGGFRPGGSVMVDPRDGTLQMVFPDGWVQHLGQLGTVQPSYVCLQTREGLLAVDPLTGKRLWTRSDVSPATRMFGDDRYVYLVNVNQQGNATSTRALRASDGAWVRDVPDFSEAYQQRHRILDGRILASDTNNGKVTLRLYDVPAGKDVWKREFAAGTLVLHSEDAGLGGVVEPDGKVTVIDLRTQKEVLRATLDPKPPAKSQGVSLLSDRANYYLAVNGPRDATVPWPQQSNFQPGSGLRCLPVSGNIFAFARDTGQLAWRIEVPTEMLVLDQFQDLPILVFTSRYQMWQVAGFGRNVQQRASLHAFDKRTGKIFYRVEDGALLGQMFHSFNVDLREGKVELLSYTHRVVLTRAPDSTTADAGTRDSDGPGGVRP